jgi:hypothetical protein
MAMRYGSSVFAFFVACTGADFEAFTEKVGCGESAPWVKCGTCSAAGRSPSPATKSPKIQRCK